MSYRIREWRFFWFYTGTALARLRFIRHARQIGFTIAAIC
ncbi:MerR family DNA-binding protein [Cronobacter malonaticus]